MLNLLFCEHYDALLDFLVTRTGYGYGTFVLSVTDCLG